MKPYQESEGSRVVPITPTQAAREEFTTLPDYVLMAVNELLTEKYNAHGFKLMREEVIARILKIAGELKVGVGFGTLSRADIFQHKMLNFETLYRKKGWMMTYMDDSDYTQSSPAWWEVKVITEHNETGYSRGGSRC